MARVPLNFPPGLYANGTIEQASGRWYDGHLIRFHEGTIRPWRGWKPHARSLSAPFATTNASPVVTVTDTAHGASAGETVRFSGASSVAGITLSGAYTIATVTSANAYTVVHTSNANATTTGGGDVSAQYYVVGAARAITTWSDNDSTNWIAVGTSARLLILNRTADTYDITPIRATSAGLSGPFAVTNGSPTVTVTDTAHGAAVGDYVTFSGASAVGGVTIDGKYLIVTAPDADTYTITHFANATSTTTGGGTVSAAYQISPGLAGASTGGGYGDGAYGAGPYNVSADDPDLIQPAAVWFLDNFGENLLALRSDDGRLFKWSLNTATPATLVVKSGSTDVPVNCRAMVITETAHVMLLGADGDGRLVAWCDAQDETLWDAGLPSEAGTFPLQTGGQLMCGKRTRGGTLLLTDQDAWLATYYGGANPYAFNQVSTGCGVISQAAAVSTGTGLVAWMGRDGFWLFNGDVQPIACEVSDRVFKSINRVRSSHVTAYHKQQFGEIVWHYPSATASENDRYIVWNYREGHWTTGLLGRTCGTDRGTFSYPLAIDVNGAVWRHETDYEYDGATPADPYLESGPFQFGADGEAPGERVFTALSLIPDELALGNVEATFYGRFYPTGEESTFGPYAAANPTDIRFTTRHARMRLTGDAATGWRVGAFQLDIVLGGLR